jgi:hypothetical protein
MEKKIKTIAILLIVAIIVCAAGCAGKTTNSGNETPGNETPYVSNQTTSAVTTPSPIETQNVTKKANETVTEGNNTEKTENITMPVIRKATYVAPHEPSSEANQITYTVYNNSEDNTPDVSNQGTLKITPGGTNTTQGNTTTIGDPLRKQKIAQNHTSTNKTISI